MRALKSWFVLQLLLSASVLAEDWPQWRGPNGNGVSPEEGIPTRWSKDDNIAWKAPLGGLAISSPVVWGDSVFVTSQAGQGVLKRGNHPSLARGEDRAAELPLGGSRNDDADAGVSFLVEAFHRSDGHRLWEYRFQADEELYPVHSKHNLASPSPVTDGEQVYVWFGTGQLVALDMEGKPIWQRNLGRENGRFEINWGHAASPTLYEDLLILLCDHTPVSYLLAVDKRTGKDKWKVDRGRGRSSYSTPFVVRGKERDELIVNSSQRVDAFNPSTGELLWYTGKSNRFPIPVPSYDDGVLYMSRGYRSGPYMALRTGGKGDVRKSHIQWRGGTGAPYVSSVLYYQGFVYMANGNGVVRSIDGKTGERVWQERLGGIFTASPVAADGKIYLLAESGEMIVLRAGRELQVLARNRIEARSVASPAISNGQIFIRTDQHLICIGNTIPRREPGDAPDASNERRLEAPLMKLPK